MYRWITFILVAVFGLSGNVNAAGKDKPAMKTGLALDTEIGLGYDSNIYRAPGSSYINYADSCTIGVEPNCVVGSDGNGYIFVEPKIQSGMYIPAELNLDFVKGLTEKNFLVTEYKFDGEFYVDSKYDNANNYGHRFRVGDEYVIDHVGSKTHSIYVGGLLQHKKRLYLDRDTGEEQTSSGNIDISSRYTYDAIGVEADYKNRVSAWQYDLEFKLYNRNYEDPVIVSQYDHTYYRVGADVKYQVAKPTKLTFGYKFYVYDYDERPSRDADGRLLLSNPTRKYEYNRFDFTVRQRFSDSLVAYFDYERKIRNDKYVGYDDYTKDLFKVRMLYKINKNNNIKVSYAYWERDYPNAFAFNNSSIRIPKQYDGTDLEISATTQLAENKAIVVDFEYVDENTTDLRYDYDRYKAFVSYQWEF
jgi:hypothetical protein